MIILVADVPLRQDDHVNLGRRKKGHHLRDMCYIDVLRYLLDIVGKLEITFKEFSCDSSEEVTIGRLMQDLLEGASIDEDLRMEMVSDLYRYQQYCLGQFDAESTG